MFGLIYGISLALGRKTRHSLFLPQTSRARSLMRLLVNRKGTKNAHDTRWQGLSMRSAYSSIIVFNSSGRPRQGLRVLFEGIVRSGSGGCVGGIVERKRSLRSLLRPTASARPPCFHFSPLTSSPRILNIECWLFLVRAAIVKGSIFVQLAGDTINVADDSVSHGFQLISRCKVTSSMANASLSLLLCQAISTIS